MPPITKFNRAANHLRRVLKARLEAWNASCRAEELLETDIDSQGQGIDDYLADVRKPEEIDRLLDEDVFEIFGVDVELPKKFHQDRE